jgi:hypothetical protein
LVAYGAKKFFKIFSNRWSLLSTAVQDNTVSLPAPARREGIILIIDQVKYGKRDFSKALCVEPISELNRLSLSIQTLRR